MLKTKLTDLAQRAANIKADPAKRHMPNKHDIAKSNENAKIMQPAQYQSIHWEGDNK